MPKRSKRRLFLGKQLTIARRGKRRRLLPVNARENEASSHRSSPEVVRAVPERLEDLLQLSEDALDTEDEVTDPSFDLNESIQCDGNHILDDFCEEWVTHLDREDRTALGVFLYVQMKTLLAKGETEAAELAGIMTGRSDKSIRDWKMKCVSTQEGRPNLTAGMFCHWVNETLLPSETLEPGFPRKVGVDTARKWMHELGFQVMT